MVSLSHVNKGSQSNQSLMLANGQVAGSSSLLSRNTSTHLQPIRSEIEDTQPTNSSQRSLKLNAVFSQPLFQN